MCALPAKYQRASYVLFLSQSMPSRSWNECLVGRREIAGWKVLLSPPYLEPGPHACGFNCCWIESVDWKMIVFFSLSSLTLRRLYCHESDKFYICLCNVRKEMKPFFSRSSLRSDFEACHVTLRWLCAHKYFKSSSSSFFTVEASAREINRIGTLLSSLMST